MQHNKGVNHGRNNELTVQNKTQNRVENSSSHTATLAKIGIDNALVVEALRKVITEIVYDILQDYWQKNHDIAALEKRAFAIKQLFREGNLWGDDSL